MAQMVLTYILRSPLARIAEPLAFVLQIVQDHGSVFRCSGGLCASAGHARADRQARGQSRQPLHIHPILSHNHTTTLAPSSANAI